MTKKHGKVMAQGYLKSTLEGKEDVHGAVNSQGQGTRPCGVRTQESHMPYPSWVVDRPPSPDYSDPAPYFYLWWDNGEDSDVETA